MNIISVRESPEYLETVIEYFQRHWANENSLMVYRDCIERCIAAPSPLPQWYLLRDGDKTVGGAGLITNDFISRMDLCPWLCALYIEPEYRGRALGRVLIERIKADSRAFGYDTLYLCSDHVGYYEHYGFTRIATGYHPWGETSGVFAAPLK